APRSSPPKQERVPLASESPDSHRISHGARPGVTPFRDPRRVRARATPTSATVFEIGIRGSDRQSGLPIPDGTADLGASCRTRHAGSLCEDVERRPGPLAQLAELRTFNP